MTTGTYILTVPAGKVDPITQTRTKRRIVETLEVGPSDDGRLLVKCAGCWPPDGFHISAEHWAAQWAPYAKEGAGT